MLEAILLDNAVLSKAVRVFKTTYPNTARQYALELKKARTLVQRGKVTLHDRLERAYFVTDRTDPEPFLVMDRHCDCGELNLCRHRLAVNLAQIGRAIVHVAANEAALEANEVHAELAEQSSEVQP
jgi:hypothetical protein